MPNLRERVKADIRDEMISTEGRRNTVYRDTLGKPTVGIGHLVLPQDNLKVGDVISNERIEQLFTQDIEPVIDAAMSQAEQVGRVNYDFVMALCQVNFQLGPAWTGVFYTTWPAIKNHQWDRAISGIQNSVWMRQTPVRATNFINSLKKEKSMTETKSAAIEDMTLEKAQAIIDKNNQHELKIAQANMVTAQQNKRDLDLKEREVDLMEDILKPIRSGVNTSEWTKSVSIFVSGVVLTAFAASADYFGVELSESTLAFMKDIFYGLATYGAGYAITRGWVKSQEEKKKAEVIKTIKKDE